MPESGSRPPVSVDSCDLSTLTGPEVRRILEREPRLLLAVGALEQHGPHLPLGANALIAARVVEAVSDATGVLRAPTLRYGVRRSSIKRFPGTAGMRRKTFHRMVNELLESWEEAGLEEIILVTAHRYEPHLDALLMTLTSEAETTVVDLRSIPVDDILDGDPATEHAGELETSLLLHLAPDRVRREEIADFVPDPRDFRKYVQGRSPTPPPGSRGAVGRPSRATEEKGRRVFERFVHMLETRVVRG